MDTFSFKVFLFIFTIAVIKNIHCVAEDVSKGMCKLPQQSKFFVVQHARMHSCMHGMFWLCTVLHCNPKISSSVMEELYIYVSDAVLAKYVTGNATFLSLVTILDLIVIEEIHIFVFFWNFQTGEK